MDKLGRWNKQLGWLAITLASFFLAGALEHAWRSWHRLKLIDVADVVKPASKGILVGASSQTLADWHLFGSSVRESIVVPQTQLQLELSGLMLSPSEADSMAMIGIAGQSAQLYRVGDKLDGTNVRVHAITAKAVILENGGHLERLVLPRSPLKFGDPPEQLLSGG